MKHTSHADYALRVLLYLRVAPGRHGSTGEMAEAHHVSRNHLDKVVNRLARAGLVETTRGRGGGVQLTRDPSTITVGEIMRAMESDFAVVECLGPARYCRVAGVCGARSLFARALVSSAGNPMRISAEPAVSRQGAGPSLVPGVLGRTSNAADVQLGRRDTWRISGGGH